MDNRYMKHWNLLGSLDGICYEIIKAHSHWISPFGGPGKSKTFKIDNANKYYNHFKIEITGKNSDGWWHITFNGFEIYGDVYGNRK